MDVLRYLWDQLKNRMTWDMLIDSGVISTFSFPTSVQRRWYRLAMEKLIRKIDHKIDQNMSHALPPLSDGALSICGIMTKPHGNPIATKIPNHRILSQIFGLGMEMSKAFPISWTV
jgi:hypothetical protein